ncbi:Cytochrome b-c1 complex subunit 8 [Golovinomyces cichoracearum]|uniref:Cytochrome b-c1 complex subunit 8 n=1 Tax=Golovinomyces cichoracearum TaxID=62708 RepID=A0A420J092_9PEZI|nr:Cytochrome b-c1 complex subunit 8 [Golovinomyces cichoracearum]
MKLTQVLRASDGQVGKYGNITVKKLTNLSKDISETGATSRTSYPTGSLSAKIQKFFNINVMFLGLQKQKGVASYALSANQQRPLAGAFHAAIFNTWRRFSAQVLYIAPPFIIAYTTLQWAIERNEYLNSKQGRMEFSEEE